MAMPLEIDPLCNYEMFTFRNQGMVPCVAVGHDDLNDIEQKAEITGLHFQHVSEGYVKAMLDTNLFSPVNWSNSPINLRRNNNIFCSNLALNFIVPSPKWSRFGTVMSELYAKMLERMTPLDGGAAPTTILQGLESDIWADRNGHQLRNYQRFVDKWNMISEFLDADTQHYKVFMESFVGGFCSDEGISNCLDHLLKINDSFVTNQNACIRRCLVKAQADTTKNQPIVSGLVHCLVYGFHQQQIEMRNEMQGGNRQGRLQHRVILPKANDVRQKSRSRSPSPSNEINLHVRNIHNQGPQDPNLQQVLRSPGDYILKSHCLHHYFEPHKPDYLVFEGKQQNAEVKVLIEVSSYKKHGGLSFNLCLEKDTEQCVQQCLAGLSYNQQKIHGLLIIPDGLKLICVKKLVAPGLPEHYEVSESEFIPWSNSQGISMILYELKAFLMEGWGNPWDYLND